MPIPAAPIIAAVVLVGAGVGANAYMKSQDAKKAKAKKKKKSTARVEPVFAENATLANSPAVISQLVFPIEIGELGPVDLRSGGDIVTYNKLTIRSNEVLGDGKKLSLNPQQALKALVTNLSPQATKKAWDSLKKDIRIDGGVTFDVPSYDMDRTVTRVLEELQPSTDWSKGVDKASTVEIALWSGVVLLGELMYQSIWNTYAEQQHQGGGGGSGGGGGGGAANDEGGAEEATTNPVVENGWINWYDKGDLKGISKVVSSGNYGKPTAPFFAQIKIFEDDMTRANGTYTGVASYAGPDSDGLVILYGKDIGKLRTNLTNMLNAKKAQG